MNSALQKARPAVHSCWYAGSIVAAAASVHGEPERGKLASLREGSEPGPPRGVMAAQVGAAIECPLAGIAQVSRRGLVGGLYTLFCWQANVCCRDGGRGGRRCWRRLW